MACLQHSFQNLTYAAIPPTVSLTPLLDVQQDSLVEQNQKLRHYFSGSLKMVSEEDVYSTIVYALRFMPETLATVILPSIRRGFLSSITPVSGEICSLIAANLSKKNQLLISNLITESDSSRECFFALETAGYFLPFQDWLPLAKELIGKRDLPPYFLTHSFTQLPYSTAEKQVFYNFLIPALNGVLPNTDSDAMTVLESLVEAGKAGIVVPFEVLLEHDHLVKRSNVDNHYRQKYFLALGDNDNPAATEQLKRAATHWLGTKETAAFVALVKKGLIDEETLKQRLPTVLNFLKDHSFSDAEKRRYLDFLPALLQQFNLKDSYAYRTYADLLLKPDFFRNPTWASSLPIEQITSQQITELYQEKKNPQDFGATVLLTSYFEQQDTPADLASANFEYKQLIPLLVDDPAAYYWYQSLPPAGKEFFYDFLKEKVKGNYQPDWGNTTRKQTELNFFRLFYEQRDPEVNQMFEHFMELTAAYHLYNYPREQVQELQKEAPSFARQLGKVALEKIQSPGLVNAEQLLKWTILLHHFPPLTDQKELPEAVEEQIQACLNALRPYSKDSMVKDSQMLLQELLAQYGGIKSFQILRQQLFTTSSGSARNALWNSIATLKNRLRYLRK